MAFTKSKVDVFVDQASETNALRVYDQVKREEVATIMDVPETEVNNNS